MKPWEETWHVSDRQGTIALEGLTVAIMRFVGPGDWSAEKERRRAEQEARARLAAQAPAMARLLLTLSVELKDDTDWSSELCGAFERISEVLKAAGVKP